MGGYGGAEEVSSRGFLLSFNRLHNIFLDYIQIRASGGKCVAGLLIRRGEGMSWRNFRGEA